MSLELILKDIEDTYVRENFFRVSKYVSEEALLNGEFKFYEAVIPNAATEYKFRHGRDFVPKDIIFLSAEGDQNFSFVFQKFDRDNLVINTSGPVKIRFLAGRYDEEVYQSGGQPFPYVGPNGSGGGSSGSGSFSFYEVGSSQTVVVPLGQEMVVGSDIMVRGNLIVRGRIFQVPDTTDSHGLSWTTIPLTKNVRVPVNRLLFYVSPLRVLGNLMVEGTLKEVS